MSTILKALRRLEEEKTRGASSRPLREEVASGPGEAPRRRGLPWLPVLAMLVGAGLGASAWWVWPYERAGEPVREAAAGQGPAAAPAVAPKPAENPMPGPPPVAPPDFHAAAAEIESQLHGLANVDPVTGEGPPEDAFASSVEVVERPKPAPRIEPPTQGARAERVIADAPIVATESPALRAKRSKRSDAPAPSPAPRVASAPAPAPEPAPAAAPAKPVPSAAPAERAAVPPPKPRAAEPAPARATAASAPAASRPSAASEVRVTRTQWHPEPGRRSAEVELAGRSESVHEGDVVGEYVVTEIRPSGVVLTRDGERIERGIGK